MLGILVYSSFLCVLCTGYERPGWPGYDYFPQLDGYLKVHQVPADWKQARATCHREGALLASPWSAEFTSTITDLQSRKYPSLPTLYSGAGLKTGSSGVPMESCENERCSTFTRGYIQKVTCNQLLPYACFAPAPLFTCKGNDYTFNSQTGQCYKFHSDEATAPRAKTICIQEGGYLAKINDPTEEKELLRLGTGFTFIDNDNGGTEYRHLLSTYYDDYKCDEQHTFICEKTASSVNRITSDLRD